MKKARLLIYILLTVGCAVGIFILSSQDKETSGSNSLKVLTAAAKFIGRVLHVTFSDMRIRELHSFFRKTAHFSIYTILSVFSYNTFRLITARKNHAVTAAFVFCVITAISDEIHQMFVSGRSAEIRDVFIDTLGVCFGLGLVWTVNIVVKSVVNLLKKR